MRSCFSVQWISFLLHFLSSPFHHNSDHYFSAATRRHILPFLRISSLRFTFSLRISAAPCLAITLPSISRQLHAKALADISTLFYALARHRIFCFAPPCFSWHLLAFTALDYSVLMQCMARPCYSAAVQCPAQLISALANQDFSILWRLSSSLLHSTAWLFPARPCPSCAYPGPSSLCRYFTCQRVYRPVSAMPRQHLSAQRIASAFCFILVNVVPEETAL